MTAFAPETLFELAGFAHRDLFEGVEHAWEALGERLEGYIAENVEHLLEGDVEEGAFITPPVRLAPGARIEAGAYVRGPAIIGAGSEVRHGAYLRGNILAGEGCILGHSTEIKNAVFLDGASAGHFAYVGDSVLGRRVNLGAGTKLANFRVFPGDVRVITPEGRFLPSGLLKLGAVLGDDVQIGCNAVTSPGTVIGPRSRAYALTSLRGTIAADTVVSWKPELVQRPIRK